MEILAHICLVHRVALEMKWTGSQVTEIIILGWKVISSVTLEKSLFSGSIFPFKNEGIVAILLPGQ